MSSPFPGMDPYLEQHWGDVHHSFITYARDQLRPKLPRDLRARVEERVFVESPIGRERSLVPDVRIFERGRGRSGSFASAGSLSVAEPLILEVDEPITQGFIEILDASSGNRVITVIEVLSPANKAPGEGQDLYVRKQQELRQAQVTLVEIDLLRGGKRLLPVPLRRLPPEYRTAYQVWVRRGWQPLSVEVYRASLREKLPTIKIPLRQSDADVLLDLQALIEQCYRNGSYEEDIDYQNDPEPPLGKSDARWAQALLRDKGLREIRKSRKS
jgi:uncharacterized protein DUF4058